MTTARAGTAGPAAPADAGFDPDRPYRISGRVSVRPESFGALVYDFGTRRLSFLKTRPLVAVVTGLAGHADVHDALAAAEVPTEQHPAYLRALAGLAEAGTIEPRPGPPHPGPPHPGPPHPGPPGPDA